jgi:hypothetical protein
MVVMLGPQRRGKGKPPMAKKELTKESTEVIDLDLDSTTNAAFFLHKLGATVRDQVTGLEGIIVCRMEWLYGCRRYIVQPTGTKDGKPFEASSFDEDSLILLDQPKDQNTVKRHWRLSGYAHPWYRRSPIKCCAMGSEGPLILRVNGLSSYE